MIMKITVQIITKILFLSFFCLLNLSLLDAQNENEEERTLYLTDGTVLQNGTFKVKGSWVVRFYHADGSQIPATKLKYFKDRGKFYAFLDGHIFQRANSSYFDFYERSSYVLDIPFFKRKKMLRSQDLYFGRRMDYIMPMSYENLYDALSTTKISTEAEYYKEIGKYISSKKRFTLYTLKIMLVGILPGSIYPDHPYVKLIHQFNKLAEKYGLE